MNIFVFRLLVNVRWLNQDINQPELAEYVDKLWDTMSEEERNTAASWNN
jgi:hypothetical protein